ncbi:GGDEF domain-containing protein [Neobacillus sp. Marseille-QA0830]
MFKDLFIHACIVITFLFVGGSLFKSNPKINTIRQKFKLGVLSGILGSVLMIFSIQITPAIIMDLRHIAVLLAAYFGGFTTAIISVIIISISRVVFFNGTVSTYMVTISIMFSIAIVSALITKKFKGTDFIKWTLMGTYSLAAFTLGFLYLLGFSRHVYNLLFNYWLVTTIAGILVFFLAAYIVQSNTMFNEMKLQSKIDFLTGLNNVRQFDLALNESIKKAHDQNEKLSLLLIDIDHFKKVNDTHGHQAGDEVLRQLGAILSSCSRSQDLVSRNGGEEFTVLLRNCHYLQALEAAERIRTAVEKHPFILPNGDAIKVTASIGVSTYLETTQSSYEFIKQADDSLYNAKKTGRNKVCSAFI